MRLPQPFYRLPLRFDAARLREEVAALPEAAWADHPNRITGNSCVRLISVDGEENDEVDGAMQPTEHLRASPYMRQVLASLTVRWSRSRLMRLAPGAVVPEHADINHHWFSRVRVHIPIVTDPRVAFHCDGQSVHMAEGEAWIFDNWRRHSVENGSDRARIHLVADTQGHHGFWQFVSERTGNEIMPRRLDFDPLLDLMPLTEQRLPEPLMPVSELQRLLEDFATELTVSSQAAAERVGGARQMLAAWADEWRDYHARHVTGELQREAVLELQARWREQSRIRLADLVMRANGVAAMQVIEARVLQHLQYQPRRTASATMDKRSRVRIALERPVFIIAAPRSGSSLLFETLQQSPDLVSFGDEAHWLIESHPALRPGAPGVDSNRLSAAELSAQVRGAVLERAAARLAEVDFSGRTAQASLLEKTPKNALRVPFLNALWPEARFVFLWRDPRESIASIMAAWQSRRFVTYPALPGWPGPWSLLLPPGWQQQRDRGAAALAAWQWQSSNQIALDDLTQLEAGRWLALSYADFIADAAGNLRRLCDFLGVAYTQQMRQLLAGDLPLSRYTVSPPRPDKWRVHQSAIEAELPGLQPLWQRLRRL